MNNILKTLFGIRREERMQLITALAVVLVLNALFIWRLSPLFGQEGFGIYRRVFMREFHLSGYDPLTYFGVTDWGTVYNVYRHPLLAFMIWPLYAINQLLSSLFGVNCVQYVVAVPVMLSSLYSYLFTFRIHREIIGLDHRDATLMSVFYFSMAYILLSVIVPDHFTISMFLILMTLYLSGRCIQQGREMKWWQSALLFTLTAGVTLSNGIKTFLTGLFTNGKHFFRIRFLLLGVLIPTSLIWTFSKWEYRTYVWPKEQARAAAKVRKAQEDKRREAQMSMGERQQLEHKKAARQRVLAKQAAKTGKPMKNAGFLKWTDMTTSRLETVYENLFGESIQFHQQHFLGDTLVFRPVFVRYNWLVNYGVEGAILLLFAIGLWIGRKKRFLWLALSFFLFDMFIHLVLGFGINEIFIMAPHWLFVVPFAIAYLLKSTKGKSHQALGWTIFVLTVYLLLYNGVLLGDFLSTPIEATV